PRQLEEHFSLCGQRRRIVRGKRQRYVDLPLHAVEVAESREQPLSMPLHVQALAEVAEDSEVRDGIAGVCSHGLLRASEAAREHRRALRDRALIRLVAERDRVAGRRAGRLWPAAAGGRSPENDSGHDVPRSCFPSLLLHGGLTTRTFGPESAGSALRRPRAGGRGCPTPAP